MRICSVTTDTSDGKSGLVCLLVNDLGTPALPEVVHQKPRLVA